MRAPLPTTGLSLEGGEEGGPDTDGSGSNDGGRATLAEEGAEEGVKIPDTIVGDAWLA